MNNSPDALLALSRYAHLAPGYDASCRPIEPVRTRTVALLGLQPGERVLDVACGTGLSFSLIQERIGAGGELVAVDLSPHMLGIARERVRKARWRNVTLIEAAAEQADIPGKFDAILFHYTHDVLRSPKALENVFARAKPCARVAIAGFKLASWWLAPVNLVALFRARRYLTTYEGVASPWNLVAEHLNELLITPTLFGTGYIACGITPGARRASK
jgi:ubiquinone/menaquinone biosynthesis C-methylase UbiE